MRDLAIFSSKLIFFILVLLQKPWQNICSLIYFVIAVVDSKIVLGELLDSMDLSKAQDFYIHKATKLVVICEEDFFVFTAF